MKPVVFSDLKVSSEVHYYIETLTTEYRGDARIFLTVKPNGNAYITAGMGTNNVHGLQEKDLHKGKYTPPYFAYKCIHLYESVDVVLARYNAWKERLPALRKMQAEDKAIEDKRIAAKKAETKQ